jgi:transcriptional regulator with GAF, ATPase, and Fis domain
MLRVLQSGEFERVGGERSLQVNVRVIAASNRDLEQAVRDGRFRRDLYHRLAIFPIHLPPLRERREDIPLLAAYLIMRKATQLGRNIESIPTSVMDRLLAYDWPGNVRELENVLERAIILSPGTSLRQEAFLLGSVAQSITRRVAAIPDVSEGSTLKAREREHILQTCQATGWKIKGPDGAAKVLDINPGTLFARMKKLGIRRPAGH